VELNPSHPEDGLDSKEHSTERGEKVNLEWRNLANTPGQLIKAKST
jgi:hypothetical protein